jgi:hypothetical protein
VCRSSRARAIGRACSPSGAIDGHDCVEPWGHLCLACHGFSALVMGRRGSDERSVLFDVGPSADVWLENARRLGVRQISQIIKVLQIIKVPPACLVRETSVSRPSLTQGIRFIGA